jgi:hypothetical protein
MTFSVFKPLLAAIWPYHRGQVAVPVIISVFKPLLAAIWPYRRGQVKTSMTFSVLVPLLGSVSPHRSGQVKTSMTFSVLVPLLESVWVHHCRQVAVPVHLAITVMPSCYSMYIGCRRTHALEHRNVKGVRAIHDTLRVLQLGRGSGDGGARHREHQAVQVGLAVGLRRNGRSHAKGTAKHLRPVNEPHRV